MFASTATAFNVPNYKIEQYETNSRLRRISCELKKLSFSVIIMDTRWGWNVRFLLHETETVTNCLGPENINDFHRCLQPRDGQLFLFGGWWLALSTC
jgi:hypothetical protein